MKRRVIWGAAATVLVCGAFLGWYHVRGQSSVTTPVAGQDSGKKGANRAPDMVHAVKAVGAVTGSLPIQRQTVGTVVAIASTAVNSPQAGNIAILNISDGASIKKGDLIAQLDDRVIRAVIGKDQANIAKSQASLDDAELQLQRVQDLVNRGVNTSQSGDDALAAVKVAQAQLQADKAQLVSDQVTLTNTKITAPFDGRIGAIAASLGAYLSAGAPVTTLTQMAPVYAEFTLPETDLVQIRRTYSAEKLTVTATVASADGKNDTERGEVIFIDNAIDSLSGTIRLRAELNNRSGNFWPGQSLRISIATAEIDNLVIVPNVAVQPQENGSITYVVKPDNSIEVRPVTVALRANGMAGISKGLQPGEMVVTEGQAALVNGSKVKATVAETQSASD